MNRLGRSSKTIIFLVADRTVQDVHYKTFMESVTGMSILYRTYIANERSLHQAISSQPLEKIIVVLVDEVGLQNRQFRQSFITCVAAKLNLVVFLDNRLTKERVLGFFAFVPGRRYEKLEKVLNEVVMFDAAELILKKAVIKIREIDRSKPNQVRFHTTNKRKVSKKPAIDKRLTQCLVQHKSVLIEYPWRYKNRHFYSYNLNTSSRTSTIQCANISKPMGSSYTSNIFSSQYSSSAPHLQTGIRRKQPQRSLPQVKCKTSDESASPRKSNKETVINVNPIIEIRTDKYSGITENSKNMPWMECESNSVFNDIPCVARLKKRNCSFDYISKTYVVCDPTIKKSGNNLLYVNFPHGLSLLRQDNDAARFILDSSSSYAPSEDHNLEMVDDTLLTSESPLPSPTTPKSIYLDPLPAFSDDICFPPVGLFPCDSLQIRRPSVFDVLLV